MRKVKYTNMFNDVFFPAYLVKEDENNWYVIEPIAVEWLDKVNKLELINMADLIPVEKNYRSLIDASFPASYFDEWLLDWEISESNIEEFRKVANFFEHFYYHRNKPLHLRLENAISATKYFVDKATMKKLIHFILHNQQETDQRIKILLSNVVDEFLD